MNRILTRIAWMAVGLSGVAQAAELRSASLRAEVCDAVQDYTFRGEPVPLTIDIRSCTTEAKMDVKKQDAVSYQGEPLKLTLGDQVVLSLKKGDLWLTRLVVEFTLQGQVCNVDIERAFPSFSAGNGSLRFNSLSWKSRATTCESSASNELRRVGPGDKNLKVIRPSAVPAAVRKQMGGYDLVPLIGYDGYYGFLESTTAKVLNNVGKVIGYMEVHLYSYSEDPEVHYWVFVYDTKGFLVEVPQSAHTTLGDDFIFKGSTRRLLETGNPEE